jgi:hypothetical protein
MCLPFESGCASRNWSPGLVLAVVLPALVVAAGALAGGARPPLVEAIAYPYL